METLIDKIITELNHRTDESYNHMSKHELNSVIDLIKEMEENASFKEIAGVMMKHMGAKYDPHYTAIITNVNAELLEGVKTTGKTFEFATNEPKEKFLNS